MQRRTRSWLVRLAPARGAEADALFFDSQRRSERPMSELEQQQSVIFDCIVVGIGGHGSAAIAQLAKAGVRVLGLEQFPAVHSQGSSHGKSRIYRQAYFEHPHYVPLLQRALVLWNELQEFYETEVRDRPASFSAASNYAKPEHIFTLCGGIMVGAVDSEVITGSRASAQLHGLPYEMLTAAEVRARYPLLQLLDEEVALYEPNAGYLHPEACTEAYIHMAAKHGAELHFEEQMIDWHSTEQDFLVVRSNKAQYYTKKIVLSVGAWAPEMYAKQVAMSLKLQRRVLFWFEPEDCSTLSTFVNMPIYFFDMKERGSVYGFPLQPEVPGLIKVAFHSMDGTELPCDSPNSIERRVQNEEVEKMRDVLKQKLPSVNGKLRQAMTCMYTNTTDGHFLIDKHPQNDRVILVSPCSGHGYKFCSVIGEIVSDLVTTGSTKHDISLFAVRSEGLIETA